MFIKLRRSIFNGISFYGVSLHLKEKLVSFEFVFLLNSSHTLRMINITAYDILKITTLFVYIFLNIKIANGV